MTFVKKNSGFTLVEILIALPIALMITTVLFNYLILQYGQMLSGVKKANLLLESNLILLNMEDELLFSTEYREDLRSDLSDPYSPSGGWSFMSSPTDTLIIEETALNGTRRDANREFVFRQVYSCGSYNSQYNPIAFNNIIYFTEENDRGYRDLYRRTITPTYNTCNTNIKRTSCPEANVGTGSCETQDALLSENITDFDIQYFSEGNTLLPETSDGIEDAEKIKITIESADQLFNNAIETTSSITIKKIN